MIFLLELKKIGKMPKAFEEFKFSDDQKTGAVSVFWENVHLAAKALKEDTNCPNAVSYTHLRAHETV